MSSDIETKLEDVLKMVTEMKEQRSQIAQQLKDVCAEVACLKNDLAVLRSSSPASSGEPAAKQARVDPPTSSQRRTNPRCLC